MTGACTVFLCLVLLGCGGILLGALTLYIRRRSPLAPQAGVVSYDSEYSDMQGRQGTLQASRNPYRNLILNSEGFT